MMPRPRLVRQLTSTTSRWVRNVREERIVIRGEIRPSLVMRWEDRPVKPSSAGIPLSFLGSDTVVTDMEAISANIYQEEGDRRQERQERQEGAR